MAYLGHLTHNFHNQLVVPKDIDLVIHTGDCSNQLSPYHNESEVRSFIDWYEKVDVPNKIYIPGNHDTSIEKGLVKPSDFTSKGIHLLIHDYISINLNSGWQSLTNSDKVGSTVVPSKSIKIFGSPYTPTYGQWSFMKSRDKLNRYWEQIPEDSDIVAVHGPCKGMLDLSYNRNNELEFCGDNALRKHVLNRVKPKYFLSGHIHNFEDIINTGLRYLPDYDITFSNAAGVTDRKFDFGITYNGNIIEINKQD